jgi:hypothetical protein
MSNVLYDTGRNAFLKGVINWLSAPVYAALIDTSLYTPNFGTDQYLSIIPAGAVISTSGPLTGMTAVAGVADANDVSFTAVTGATVEAIVLYVNSGVPGTSQLIAYIDTAAGLPFLPSGGNVAISWDNTPGRGIFKL